MEKGQVVVGKVSMAKMLEEKQHFSVMTKHHCKVKIHLKKDTLSPTNKLAATKITNLVAA